MDRRRRITERTRKEKIAEVKNHRKWDGERVGRDAQRIILIALCGTGDLWKRETETRREEMITRKRIG